MPRVCFNCKVSEQEHHLLILSTFCREQYEDDQLSSPPSPSSPTNQFRIGDLEDDDNDDLETGDGHLSPSGESSGEASGQHEGPRAPSRSSTVPSETTPPLSPSERSNSSIEEHVDEMVQSISNNVSVIRRIRFLDGWKGGTSPEQMKHIILLGLRIGFCGALSTFSSLNASVIRLLKKGSIGEAFFGYAVSIQLGIVSYRFGQNLAVYIFVFRCRREAKRDERRGYGLRLHNADSEDTEDEQNDIPSVPRSTARVRRRYIPSVRTIATFSFVAMILTLCLGIYFFPKHQAYIYSLLFTPFGCLARWKLMSKYNGKVPGFPLGTFSCNLLSCALSGSLGSFLAGELQFTQRNFLY